MNPLPDCINNTSADTIVAICTLLALVVSLFNSWKMARFNKEQNILNGQINEMQRQKHWRMEKIYSCLDTLFDLTVEYWISEGNGPENAKRAVWIRSYLDEIESNATILDIDITPPLVKIREYATGGQFESPTRSALPSSDEKFFHIRYNTNKIKELLQ